MIILYYHTSSRVKLAAAIRKICLYTSLKQTTCPSRHMATLALCRWLPNGDIGSKRVNKKM